MAGLAGYERGRLVMRALPCLAKGDSCMRIDIHTTPEVGKHARVFLDGIDISAHCYAANEEEGAAYCYKQRGGRFIVEHSTHCSEIESTSRQLCTCVPKKETCRGEVRIEIPGAIVERLRNLPIIEQYLNSKWRQTCQQIESGAF